MSSSYTQSSTKSYTYANTRYVNDKIIADLTYLAARFPGIFTAERLNSWKSDFYQWLNDGYAKVIKIQFKRNNICFYQIEYEMKDDGTITSDDNVGRFRGIDLSDSSTYIVIEMTPKWYELSKEEQIKYKGTLILSWGDAEQTTYASGLMRTNDKQYSSGSLGVQRSILGG
ncbi:hypothetical protein [Lysinibacillus sp. FSL L8-0126]|uniref:HORMA-1 domain-containing protein n=1 Tax=Lysinibacillus sp. FSL L8-0126 TaxID=2921515 RepID=UPI00315A04A8